MAWANVVPVTSLKTSVAKEDDCGTGIGNTLRITGYLFWGEAGQGEGGRERDCLLLCRLQGCCYLSSPTSTSRKSLSFFIFTDQSRYPSA